MLRPLARAAVCRSRMCVLGRAVGTCAWTSRWADCLRLRELVPVCRRVAALIALLHILCVCVSPQHLRTVADVSLGVVERGLDSSVPIDITVGPLLDDAPDWHPHIGAIVSLPVCLLLPLALVCAYISKRE